MNGSNRATVDELGVYRKWDISLYRQISQHVDFVFDYHARPTYLLPVETDYALSTPPRRFQTYVDTKQ